MRYGFTRRSRDFADNERLYLAECISRFEASLLLNAPASVTREFGQRLDAQIGSVGVRIRESWPADAAPTRANCARGC